MVRKDAMKMRGVSVWTYYQENMAGVEEAPERDLVTVVVDILLSLREQTNDANNNYKSSTDRGKKGHERYTFFCHWLLLMLLSNSCQPHK